MRKLEEMIKETERGSDVEIAKFHYGIYKRYLDSEELSPSDKREYLRYLAHKIIEYAKDDKTLYNLVQKHL